MSTRWTWLIGALATLELANAQPAKPEQEYPVYDGPRITVWVEAFANTAENPAYSELGYIAADVLRAELARSEAIDLKCRDDRTRLAAEGGQEGTASDPNSVDCTIKGVVASFGVRVESSGFLVNRKKQVVACELRIEIVNRGTGVSSIHVGRATSEVASASVLGAGTSSTYDRSLAQRAMRAAFGSCWAPMMQQLRAIRAAEGATAPPPAVAPAPAVVAAPVRASDAASTDDLDPEIQLEWGLVGAATLLVGMLLAVRLRRRVPIAG